MRFNGSSGAQTAAIIPAFTNFLLDNFTAYFSRPKF
jgi:hypothetical protein